MLSAASRRHMPQYSFRSLQKNNIKAHSIYGKLLLPPIFFSLHCIMHSFIQYLHIKTPEFITQVQPAVNQLKSAIFMARILKACCGNCGRLLILIRISAVFIEKLPYNP